MKRVAFKMKIKPGCAEEYEKRHRNIWPQLSALIKDTGISEYSIFLDHETHTLFAYQLVSGNQDSQDLASSEVVQKWWKYMSDIMETNEDYSPRSTLLKEVFYLE